jgi:hypothetical protein
MTWVRHLASVGEKKNAYNAQVGKHKEKKPVQKLRRR